MYGHCGSVNKKERVLNMLPVETVFSWTAHIANCSEEHDYNEMPDCFEYMQYDGVSPDVTVFIRMLRSCTSRGSMERGKKIHKEIIDRGLFKDDITLGTALVNMYGKCGDVFIAQQVLEELPVRNLVSWNTLIAIYAQHGKGIEALDCFDQLQIEGLCPDVVTYICILKACGSIGAIEDGMLIHKEIVKKGLLQKHVTLGNAVVDMYAKCGELENAKYVLEQLPVRNVVSWSALITGYAQKDLGHEALNCYKRMQFDGLCPNAITFLSVLKACGSIGDMDKGTQFHNEILEKGFIEKDIVLGVALVDMYVKCSMLTEAQAVLEGLPVRNIVAWSVLIAGYAQHGYGHEALHCLERMLSEGLSPNAVTLACLLKACAHIRSIENGKKIHEVVLDRGLLEKDVVLGNALVYMYAKCGALAKAQEVLGVLPFRNTVSWNTLISEYSQQGPCDEVWNCFERMQAEGQSPNTVTFICLLKACGSTGDIGNGRHIHNEIVFRGMLGKDATLFNISVDMYAKCGALVEAQKLFEQHPARSIVAWSALIAGYARWGQGHQALNCYEKMQCKGFIANVVTFISILKACASIGAIDKGKHLHNEIESKGLLYKDALLGNALVDMYTKCGALVEAQQALEKHPERNIVSWNVLIAGYAQQGLGREALNCLGRVWGEGLFPDGVTFLGILSACSHSGLFDKAQTLLGNMRSKYGVIPHVEHLSCMVVVYGCAGHFDRAISVIESMPTYDCPAIWLSLLGSCRKWGNVRLGKLAFDQAIQVDASVAASYVLMAATFAAAGMQVDADGVEAMRLKYAVSK